MLDTDLTSAECNSTRKSNTGLEVLDDVRSAVDTRGSGRRCLVKGGDSASIGAQTQWDLRLPPVLLSRLLRFISRRAHFSPVSNLHRLCGVEPTESRGSR
jgi:hypothetical protein